MKKRILSFAFAFLICLSISISTFAASIENSDHPERVVDMAELLSESEKSMLTKKLDSISKQHESDVVVVTADSLDGKDEMDYADDYFDYNGYGLGEDRDGILLLVGMEERVYWMSTRGDYTIDVFDDANFENLKELFVSDLSDGDYYSAFNNFADGCDNILTQSENVKCTNIFDKADVFDFKFEYYLSYCLDDINQLTQHDVFVKTINSKKITDLDAYANEVFLKQIKNTQPGTTLLLINVADNTCVYKSYGNENPEETAEIYDCVAPSVSEGEYKEAIKALLDACYTDYYGDDYEGDGYYDNGYYYDDGYMYNENPLFDLSWIIISLIIGISFSLIIVFIIRGKLKSVRMNDTASDYIKRDSMRITASDEIFLYSHVDRHAKPQESNHSSGGMGGSGGSGVHVSSSGATHGGSGGHF